MRHLQTILAKVYDSSPDDSANIAEETRLELKQFIEKLYYDLVPVYNFTYIDESQPYKDFKELLNAFIRSKQYESQPFKVSTSGTVSVIFDYETNLKFRVIHDIHHIIWNADFSLEGEYQTFKHIASLTHNKMIQDILFSEIVLQAASVLENGEFLPQKVVLI